MIKTFLTLPRWQIYLLQLENYALGRFWNLLKLYHPQRETRFNITWTAKLLLVVLGALLLQASTMVFLLSSLDERSAGAVLLSSMLWFIALILLFPIFLSTITLLLIPITAFAKSILVSRAKKKLQTLKKLKIIAITGSWGKTSAKQVLRSTLGKKYTVESTPGNINTPIGIARYLLKNVNETTDIFLVEMGAYHKGNIRELCELTPPDMAIITAIGPAHLERFGSLEAIIRTKFEIVRHSKSEAKIFLSGENEHIEQHYKEHLGDRKFSLFAAHDMQDAVTVKPGILLLDDPHHPVREVAYEGTTYSLPILGAYIAEYAALALLIGKELGLTEKEVFASLQQMQPVEHRLQPIYNAQSDILVIDDSYNGNPEGVRAACEILSVSSGRRKVYITPGLVELGEKAIEVHKELGAIIGKAADMLILIRNPNTEALAKGAQSVKAKIKIKWYNRAQDAHAALPQLLKKGDLALFQNDLTENY